MLGANHKLHILIYHRVLGEYDELRPDCLTQKQFEMHLKIFKKWFHVVPLVEGYHRMLEGSLPPRSICITFDDGYQDNVDFAMPLLKAYNMQATFFIATGFLQGQLMFNDVIIEQIKRFNQNFKLEGTSFDCARLEGKLAAIQHLTKQIKAMPHQQRLQTLQEFWPEHNPLPRLMMTSAGVRALSTGGMSIGAHTENHPLLSKETDEDAYLEIAQSKSCLEEIVQKSVSWFAYPNGKMGIDFHQKHADMVKELGFAAALSTHWGMASLRSRPYYLPRFTPWQTKTRPFLIKMASHRLSRSY